MRTQMFLSVILLLIISLSSSGADFFNTQTIKPDDQSITIFPNPVKEKGILQLKLENTTDIAIEFFDMTGKKVKEMKLQNIDSGEHKLEFDTSEMNNGVYFCRVSTNSWVKAKRIIVKQR
jgi:hypothetical protein